MTCCWSVTTGKAEAVIVEAEYLQLSEAGALCFFARDQHTAVLVHTFAPGKWEAAHRIEVQP